MKEPGEEIDRGRGGRRSNRTDMVDNELVKEIWKSIIEGTRTTYRLQERGKDTVRELMRVKDNSGEDARRIIMIECNGCALYAMVM